RPTHKARSPLLRCIARSGPAAADDRARRRFAFLAGLAALGQHAGRAARVAATRGLAFATPHRMADRIHRHAAIVRLAAHPALTAGFAERDIHVLGVRNRAERRAALGIDAADF